LGNNIKLLRLGAAEELLNILIQYAIKRVTTLKTVKRMVTKTEALYNALLPKKVVNFNDIIEKASGIIKAAPNRRYIYRKYVNRLIENGKLQRIRKGLYIVLSPLEEPEKHVVDKLLIASKIRDDYYLGFHTALEYYGSASSLYNEAYVCVQTSDRFDPFKYKRFSFKPVFVKDVRFEVEEKHYQNSTVKVSSKERTFTECIDRVQYAGGWEECIKSLQGLGGLNLEKLLTLLHKYRNDNLYRRTGYVLELLKKRSPFYEHVDDQLLNEIQGHVKGPPRYLINREKGTLQRRWKLYIPEGFEEKLRGI